MHLALFEHFTRTFIPIFVAIDSIGLAAVFLAMSQGTTEKRRRLIATQATWTGGGVALLFLFLGRSIFSFVGVTVGDFQIAGGLILFMLAARDMVRPAAEKPAEVAEDFGVVPLGMPLIAGPALIATLLLLAQVEGLLMTLIALVLNLGVVALAFAYCRTLEQWIGGTGMRAVSKIISLLLAAIAVSMIRHGWT
ncbi:MAG: MarC family protein [Verrucomicrobium sp.]|nr:MarC family protein [Verrucomicrobium sp.]